MTLLLKVVLVGNVCGFDVFTEVNGSHDEDHEGCYYSDEAKEER